MVVILTPIVLMVVGIPGLSHLPVPFGAVCRDPVTPWDFHGFFHQDLRIAFVPAIALHTPHATVMQETRVIKWAMKKGPLVV